MAAHHCYLWWRGWSDTLWAMLWLHSLSCYLQIVVLWRVFCNFIDLQTWIWEWNAEICVGIWQQKWILWQIWASSSRTHHCVMNFGEGLRIRGKMRRNPHMVHHQWDRQWELDLVLAEQARVFCHLHPFPHPQLWMWGWVWHQVWHLVWVWWHHRWEVILVWAWAWV